MKIRVPDYYNKFKCIADKCPDTCCTYWDVVIDSKTAGKYKKIQGSIGEKLRSNMIVDEDGDIIFQCHKERCPFLAKNGLCDIQRKLGEESLSYTCRQYPRFFDEFGALQEYGLSFSCPEAADIIINHKEKITFTIEENSEISVSPNDIEPELFMYLVDTRKRIFEIVQNRNLSIDERVQELYAYGMAIQQAIDNQSFKTGEIPKVKAKDSGKEVIAAFDKMEMLRNDLSVYEKNCTGIDGQAVNNFEKYMSDREYEYENFLVYMIFKYYLKAVDDYDASEKINTAILSYMAVKRMGVGVYLKSGELKKEENARIMQLYSKEIEHSTDNMQILKGLSVLAERVVL